MVTRLLVVREVMNWVAFVLLIAGLNLHQGSAKFIRKTLLLTLTWIFYMNSRVPGVHALFFSLYIQKHREDISQVLTFVFFVTNEHTNLS